MKKILVAGQGIAGTALAWALLQRGAQVHMVDGGAPTSASAVAAGIINPVTGKRFVKSWRADELLPAAKAFYRGLEERLKVPIWHETPILRLLGSVQDGNDWSARCALPDYSDWIGERPDAGPWAPFLKPGFGIGEIRRAVRVDFFTLLPAFREMARANRFFSDQRIDYQSVESSLEGFDALIFCEGWRGRDNPFFPELAWQVVKGEAFILRFKEAPEAGLLREMVKKEALIAPLGNGLFWAGGTYNWTFDDELPTEGERNILLARLNDMLAVPFDIVAHRAAVRPATKDRRPFLGMSRLHPNIGIFNGMGTKGAMLAPFWAEHFADHLLQGAPLDPEVDIRRFRN